jgi:hypothetical protein
MTTCASTRRLRNEGVGFAEADATRRARHTRFPVFALALTTRGDRRGIDYLTISFFLLVTSIIVTLCATRISRSCHL